MTESNGAVRETMSEKITAKKNYHQYSIAFRCTTFYFALHSSNDESVSHFQYYAKFIVYLSPEFAKLRNKKKIEKNQRKELTMSINHVIRFQLNAIAGKYVLNGMEKMSLCHSMRTIQRLISMKNIFNYLFIYLVEYFEVSIPGNRHFFFLHSSFFTSILCVCWCPRCRLF